MRLYDHGLSNKSIEEIMESLERNPLTLIPETWEERRLKQLKTEMNRRKRKSKKQAA